MYTKLDTASSEKYTFSAVDTTKSRHRVSGMHGLTTKTAAESPVRKGGGEWRVVFVRVQYAFTRGF
jgi:hypothetical protein